MFDKSEKKFNSNQVESVTGTNEENAELQKTDINNKAAENRAKLMNQIWGDKFLSDSLH